VGDFRVTVRPAVSEYDIATCDWMVREFHSYVPTIGTVGRVIKYLAKDDGKPAATFWLGSGFRPTPKDLLCWFGVKQSEFDGFFNEVADNKRFCIAAPRRNLGTQILRLVRERAASDWLDKYGDNLRAIVTTIGNDKPGSVYLADNWKHVGWTAGLPADRKAVSMKWNSVEEINKRFVKPTGENKKRILITERLGAAVAVPQAQGVLLKVGSDG
jgi:hypothetical protein